MGCYRPLKAYQGYYSEDHEDPHLLFREGWAQPRILKPYLTDPATGARTWSDPMEDKKLKRYLTDPSFSFTRELHLACGHCTGCRLDNARMWSIRMMHEARYSAHTHFITLTYSDENLPPAADLRYKDLSNFFKRARHDYQTEEQSFRYFACGEYGDKTLRPHYHFAAFDFKIDDLRPFKRTETGWYFLSDSLRSCWQHGHVIVAPLEWSSASYVARYVTKKMRGQDIRIKRPAANQDEEAEYYTVQRAFQSHGLGVRWYEDHKREVWDLDAVLFRNEYPVKVPRYYYKRLKAEDPEWAMDVESRRWHKAQEKPRVNLDIERDRYLLSQLQAKNLEMQTLKRSL